MPFRTLVLILAAVIVAAGATVWLATLLPGHGIEVLVPLALIGALALRLVRRR